MPARPCIALAFLLLALSASSHALAGECEGIPVPLPVPLPEFAEIEGRTLALNGAGMRSVSYLFLEIDVYLAALYLEHPMRQARDVLDGPSASRLSLHFQRAVPREQLTDGFSEAFERADPEHESLAPRLERLNGWMHDMDAGVELIFDYVPDDGVAVTVAGTRLGTIPGADFARTLLGNWLGPYAVDPRLEASLLGGSCVEL